MNALLKIDPGVNFTNILHANFMWSDPKSAENTVKPSVFFALLGSAPEKALCKMLVKSTPGVNFNNFFTITVFIQNLYDLLFCAHIFAF